LALTPPELVEAHLHLPAGTVQAMRKGKQQVTG